VPLRRTGPDRSGAERPALTDSSLPCVVHLVRYGNPPEALGRFVESYRRHDAGESHRLILLCKGFPDVAALAPHLERLDGLSAERLEVPDDGFDLTAYRRAAARLDGAVACYLNSHSVLLSAGWLERLLAPLRGGAGIVGATGSWNSGRSTACYALHLPSAYDEVFPDRAWYRDQSRRLGGAVAPPVRDLMAHPPLRYARTAYRLTRYLALFPSFPAPHVRTNAFAIRSNTMLRLRYPRLRSKASVWTLESGRGSITDQIQAMGLPVLVAGRDGRVFGPAEWADSDTLWQREQGNLLVADNQTETYRLGDLDRRMLLSRVAWGSRARPQ